MKHPLRHASFGKILFVLTAAFVSLCATQAGAALIWDEFEGETPIFDNFNGYTISKNLGTTQGPTFTIDESTWIQAIRTWHNQDDSLYGGGGSAGVSIGLFNVDKDQQVGMWAAAGHWPNVKTGYNVDWWASPDYHLVLEPGTYRFTNSDPGTWAFNAQSGSLGFSQVFGSPVPIPGTILLLAPGVVGLLMVRRKLRG